jgi:hypothetical protein
MRLHGKKVHGEWRFFFLCPLVDVLVGVEAFANGWANLKKVGLQGWSVQVRSESLRETVCIIFYKIAQLQELCLAKID